MTFHRGKRRSISAAVLVLGCALLSVAAAALAKPVEIVVGTAAGGYLDILGRILADDLGKRWQTPVIVVPKTGAGTLLSMRYTADDSAADGHTLLLNGFGHITTRFKKAATPLADDALAPVSMVCETPLVLYVRPGIPAKTLPEFLAWARAQPNGVTFGSPGISTSPHIHAENFAAATGLNMLHVPYRGNVAVVNAMLGGQVDAVFDSTGTKTYVDAGRLRALMLARATPLADWPGLPTADTAGLPGFQAVSWIGLFVAGKTPVDVQDKLNEDINATLRLPDVQAKLIQMGCLPAGSTRQGFASFLEGEHRRLKTLIEARKIDLE
jgi:tripartite-type tricarboxylate transporter receptor subunit TctC